MFFLVFDTTEKEFAKVRFFIKKLSGGIKTPGKSLRINRINPRVSSGFRGGSGGAAVPAALSISSARYFD